MKSVTVTLVPGLKFQHKISDGKHEVVTDVESSVGGNDGGPDPKALALGALGACIAMTIIMVAPRKKWDLQRLSVKVTQTDEPDPDNAGKKRLVITEELTVEGNLSQAELDEIKATAGKCPVFKLMTEPKHMVTTVNHVTAQPAAASSATIDPAATAAGSELPDSLSSAAATTESPAPVVVAATPATSASSEAKQEG